MQLDVSINRANGRAYRGIPGDPQRAYIQRVLQHAGTTASEEALGMGAAAVAER
ncbi:hypothetical protein [Pseudomonas sp. WHRI 8519]|uniref:hypothetical protein n=1 Tax=Pseudomonas sp. WHRI 8519 TaxID=3162567 RepID=UPI0032EB726E